MLNELTDIRRAALDDLVLDPENARAHPEANIQAIMESLRVHGQVEPLIHSIDAGHLVGGNGRLMAMRRLGWTHCAVVDYPGPVEEARALSVRLNKSAELAKWDPPNLGKTLLALVDAGIEFQSLGFQELELKALLAPLDLDTGWDKIVTQATEPVESAEPSELSEASEVPSPSISRPGDLWLLGEHRLLCGDATNSADVARLLGDTQIGLCFTSPPYGQQRDYEESVTEHIADWDALMRGAFSHMPIAEGGQVLVNLGPIHMDGEWWEYWAEWVRWMSEQGWARFGWYIWDKGFGLPGHWKGRFAPSHEFIFHFNRKIAIPAKTARKKTMRLQLGRNLPDKSGKHPPANSVCLDENKVLDSVIRVPRETTNNIGHPAPFPVKLAATILPCWPGAVYDPFCGSGSTLLAAEQLGRQCFGMEVEPKYCDIVVSRWQKLTGNAAKLAEAPKVVSAKQRGTPRARR